MALGEPDSQAARRRPGLAAPPAGRFRRRARWKAPRPGGWRPRSSAPTDGTSPDRCCGSTSRSRPSRCGGSIRRRCRPAVFAEHDGPAVTLARTIALMNGRGHHRRRSATAWRPRSRADARASCRWRRTPARSTPWRPRRRSANGGCRPSAGCSRTTRARVPASLHDTRAVQARRWHAGARLGRRQPRARRMLLPADAGSRAVGGTCRPRVDGTTGDRARRRHAADGRRAGLASPAGAADARGRGVRDAGRDRPGPAGLFRRLALAGLSPRAI